jgi:hypothetical protein
VEVVAPIAPVEPPIRNHQVRIEWSLLRLPADAWKDLAIGADRYRLLDAREAQDVRARAGAKPEDSIILSAPTMSDAVHLLGGTVKYRDGARQPDGTWVPLVQTVNEGPSVTWRPNVRAGRLEVDVTLRLATIARPMATTTVRPTREGGSIEIDVPQWSIAVSTARVPFPREGGHAVFAPPGIGVAEDGSAPVVLFHAAIER